MPPRRARTRSALPALAVVATLGLAGCGAAGDPPTVSPAGVDMLEVPTPSPDPGDFVEQVDNPWLPLLPGAEAAVRVLEASWPLGLASSANRELIDLFLELSGFGDAFRVTVSSEEVARGKPSPDVYLRAAELLGADPARCVAIEDSSNGIRAGHAAGMTVIAVPNPHYPPAQDALDLAAATVAGVAEITPALVESLG